MRRLLLPLTALALLVTGCSAAAPGTSAAPGASVVDSPSAAGTSAPTGAAGELLARHGVAAGDVVQIVDRLDRLSPAERPAGLIASVRPGELRLSDDRSAIALPMPENRFYLSIAPYVQQTHECYFHSLTTCRGELAGEPVSVRVQDDDGTVLADETTATFSNGFVGLWLPRGVHGTIRVTHAGRTGQVRFATGDEDPTCLTTLRLS